MQALVLLAAARICKRALAYVMSVQVIQAQQLLPLVRFTVKGRRVEMTYSSATLLGAVLVLGTASLQSSSPFTGGSWRPGKLSSSPKGTRQIRAGLGLVSEAA